MPKTTVLHVTAEVERTLSRQRMPGLDAALIPNGVEIPPPPEDRAWRPDGRLRLMFLSRLAPKKGLEGLFEALTRLPDHVTLDIYGTGDADYSRSLETIVEQRGLSARVRFLGHCTGEDKIAAFEKADLFVLPSHSENFGIVIAESLVHGVPVVTTTMTPWAEIEDVGCGRWIENTPDALERAITDLQDADLEAMGRRGRRWATEHYAWPRIADQMIALYRSMTHGSPKRG